MASQQAWDDFESFRGLVAGVDSQIVGTMRNYLENIYEKYNDVMSDQERSAEVVALADTHPVQNSTYLIAEVGKLLSLREWLIANGFFAE